MGSGREGATNLICPRDVSGWAGDVTKLLKSEASLSGGGARRRKSVAEKVRGIWKRTVGKVFRETAGEKQTEQHPKSEAGRAARVGPSVPIYQIPSVFFRELVERERGFRMILMSRPCSSAHAYMCEDAPRQEGGGHLSPGTGPSTSTSTAADPPPD